MKKTIFFLLLAALLIVACLASESAVQTPLTQTQAASPSPTLTKTPAPTITPRPTNTLKPTQTNTPVPEPLTFTGTGDSVIDVSAKWDGPAILHIVGPTAYDNFIVQAYDNSGEEDLLVNEIGAYDGRIPIEFTTRDIQVSKLEITAGGEWTITIYPLAKEYIDILEAPGIYEDHRDNVIGVKGSASVIIAKCNQDVNFAIWSYSSTEGRDLLFNEIGPYEGTKILPNNTFMLVIQGMCDWSIELK